MVLMTCDCLNIRVHVRVSSVTPVDVAQLDLTNKGLSDPFFQNGVVTATLDLAGITKQVTCMVKTRNVGEWNVQSCINCRCDGFATHVTKGLDYVLISKKLQSDVTIINGKMKSEDFSPLFKILLTDVPRTPDLKKQCPSVGIDWHIRQSEALETALTTLKQQLNKFLKSEQDDMEERIRSYVEQQREAFNVLRKRVQKDKEAISGILLKSEEENIQNSLTEAIIDNKTLTPPLTPNNIDNNNQAPSSPLNDNADMRERLTSEEQDEVVSEIPTPSMMRQRPQSFGRPLHGKMAIRKKVVINAPRIAKSLDIDVGIFHLEGVEDEVAPPFYHSEDDNTDVDDLSDKSSDDVFIPNKKNTFRYPMSLPLDVPIHNYRNQQLFMQHLSHNEIDEDEKISLPDDPAQVAASFKALAKSVRFNDTTEMFGDLPRPRLNTHH